MLDTIHVTVVSLKNQISLHIQPSLSSTKSKLLKLPRETTAVNFEDRT